MRIEEVVQAVGQNLFADEGMNVFAVLDGASVPGLLPKLDGEKPPYECLYRGELAPDLAEAAPYLAQLEQQSEFTKWVTGHGWGKHWGIFAVTAADLRAMRQHFRRFLTVHDSKGQPLLFRYYDPRVMRSYLPTCNAEELTAFFGPVVSYLLEAQTPDTLFQFRMDSGKLLKARKRLDRT